VTTSERIRQVVTANGRLSERLDSLADSANLYHAGLTSHASVNVMLALEDEFDVEFPERLLSRSTFESISSIREALEELLSEGASGGS
jgi:acyl carrier protein